jgi:hypothetical protein
MTPGRVMPRYFFNVRDHDLIVDRTGIELSGLAEARRQACELMALGKRILPKVPFWLVVTDENNKTVFELSANVPELDRL